MGRVKGKGKEKRKQCDPHGYNERVVFLNLKNMYSWKGNKRIGEGIESFLDPEGGYTIGGGESKPRELKQIFPETSQGWRHLWASLVD